MEYSRLEISEKRQLPKYKQIIEFIIEAINRKELKNGDKLPSINCLKTKYNISRDTVFQAYNELKAKGIVTSHVGKGFFITSTIVDAEHKVFILFDELNAFKEVLFNSLIEHLGPKASIDIYFHHFNRKVFNSLIENNLDNYNTYIIMPAKFQGITPLLKKIRKGNIYILDQFRNELKSFPSVFQNFHLDVISALEQGLELLNKYDKIIMVYPGGKEPIGQVTGFKEFCLLYNKNYEVVKSLENRGICSKEAYITISDTHMVELIKKANKKNLKIGSELGIISYNDTPLKEVVVNGITTISTDFYQMGKTLANIILKKKDLRIENPSSLIIRGSL